MRDEESDGCGALIGGVLALACAATVAAWIIAWIISADRRLDILETQMNAVEIVLDIKE